MKEIIKQKLDLIDELFPLERIEKSKERIRSIYRNEIFDIPICHYPYGTPYYDLPELFGGWDGWIEKQLDECIIHGYLEDDFIPTIFPGCNIGTLPSMFGCNYKVVGNDVVVEQSVFQSEDIENVDFKISENILAQYWLDFEEYIINETENRINVNVIDSQGPNDAAGKIYNYERLFEMSFDNSELYHCFLNKVTDAFIYYWNKQKNILGNRFVPSHLYGWNWCPENVGVSLSCDSVVMVSPKFYEKFYKPYIEKVSKELGGLILHSCGYFENKVPNLCNTKGLVGINAGQMTCEELFNSDLNKNTVIIPLIFNENIKNNLECIKKNNLRVFLNIGFNDSEENINIKNYSKIKDNLKYVREFLKI